MAIFTAKSFSAATLYFVVRRSKVVGGDHKPPCMQSMDQDGLEWRENMKTEGGVFTSATPPRDAEYAELSANCATIRRT